tara:strand:- start:47 stop:859 length:813 start_codon:yes stop_codon:yes gene_type:complete
VKALKFSCDGTGSVTAEELPLRLPHASGVIDPEPFRARARGEGPALPEAFAPSAGVRTIFVDPANPCPLFGVDDRLLTFVISGQVAVTTGNEEILFRRGDLFLVDNGQILEPMFETSADCRLIQIFVGADWPGNRARIAKADSAVKRVEQSSNFKRMYRGADDKSYFKPFDSLFGPVGEWSIVTPLVGFRFIRMAADTFIDWHPEVVNNFVIVMSGGLQLEVGGGAGAVEIFRPGDICLAEDRTGEGHIDRVHGEVLVAILIVEDEHLWP